MIAIFLCANLLQKKLRSRQFGVNSIKQKLCSECAVIYQCFSVKQEQLVTRSRALISHHLFGTNAR